MSGMSDLWQQFEHDPRSPAYAAMRASDADRELVHQALGDAFAQGRLDREELDERTDAVNAAKTLGELPPVLADLVPTSGSASLVRPSPDVHAQAVAKWEKSRRDALMGFLTPTLICWAIWFVVGFGGFVWPVFVMIPTGLGLLSTLVRKQDIIASHERKILQKREQPPELEA